MDPVLKSKIVPVFSSSCPYEADFEAFVSVLFSLKKFSHSTLEVYFRDVFQFLNYVAELPDGPRLTAEIGHSHILEYLIGCEEKKPSPRTKARVLSSLRRFFRVAVQRGWIQKSPLLEISNPKKGLNLPKVLEWDQIERLFDFQKNSRTTYRGHLAYERWKRDCALLGVLYCCGLRASEATGLTTESLNLEERWLKVQGKGGKQRLVPFPLDLARELSFYVQDVRVLFKPESAFLFLNHHGKKLSRQYLWDWIKVLGDSIGLKNLSPHWLRHSFATHLLKGGMNLRVLQILLGHSDLTTTQVYTHLDGSHLKEVHYKFHPRGQQKA